MAWGQIGRSVQVWTSRTGPMTPASSHLSEGGCLIAMALVAHLGNDTRLGHGGLEGAHLADRMAEGLLHVHVLAISTAINAAGKWVWSGVVTVTASMALACSFSICR